MSVRTLVFEPFEHSTIQVMVELRPDGSVTLAHRIASSGSWSRKFAPVMDDDGEHLRAPEHKVIGDSEFADYLASLPKDSK